MTFSFSSIFMNMRVPCVPGSMLMVMEPCSDVRFTFGIGQSVFNVDGPRSGSDFVTLLRQQGIYLCFFFVPLHRFCIVSEVLFNIHLCKAFQCLIPSWEGATSSQINSLGAYRWHGSLIQISTSVQQPGEMHYVSRFALFHLLQS